MLQKNNSDTFLTISSLFARSENVYNTRIPPLVWKNVLKAVQGIKTQWLLLGFTDPFQLCNSRKIFHK